MKTKGIKCLLLVGFMAAMSQNIIRSGYVIDLVLDGRVLKKVSLRQLGEEC
jgi:hypothetical protein